MERLGRDRCAFCFYGSYHTVCEDHFAVWHPTGQRHQVNQTSRAERMERLRESWPTVLRRCGGRTKEASEVLAKRYGVAVTQVQMDLRALGLQEPYARMRVDPKWEVA